MLKAQNEQKKEFLLQDSVLQSLNDSLLKILPELKELLEKRPGPVAPFSEADKLPLSHNFQHNPYRMPVLGQGIHFHSNMPVYVPDSTVHYYIKQKKLGLHNPVHKKK